MFVSMTYSICTGSFRVQNEIYNHTFTISMKFEKEIQSSNKLEKKKKLSLFLPLSHAALSACTHSVQSCGNVSPRVLFQNPGMSSNTHIDLLPIPKTNDEARFKLRYISLRYI